jgi:hypothetical protein
MQPKSVIIMREQKYIEVMDACKIVIVVTIYGNRTHCKNSPKHMRLGRPMQIKERAINND